MKPLDSLGTIPQNAAPHGDDGECGSIMVSTVAQSDITSPDKDSTIASSPA